jgi:hypothetical protein
MDRLTEAGWKIETNDNAFIIGLFQIKRDPYTVISRRERNTWLYSLALSLNFVPN